MIWYIVATFMAFFIKGLCGFANTLIFDTILGFTVSNITISPLEVVLGFPSNIILAIHGRKKLNWRIWFPPLIFLMIGSLLGIYLLESVNSNIIKIIFGIVVMLLGIDMLIQKNAEKSKPFPKPAGVIISILSGLLCGMYGVGVLIAAYMNRITKSTEEFKANLAFLFVLENIIRIITYALAGIFTFAIFKKVLFLIPIMLIAVFCGIKAGEILDDKLIKKFVIILLILSGLALIIKQVI